MEWLRWYQGTVTDPKWRLVASESGQPLVAVLAVWASILEHASQTEPRGTITGWRPKVVAAALDLSADAVQAIHDAMQGLVLDGDQLTGWDRRQPRREDSSVERTRAWRGRKAAAAPNPDPPPTPPNGTGHRHSPNGVTPGDAVVTRSDAPEESRGEKRTTTTTLTSFARIDEGAAVIDLDERRPSEPPAPPPPDRPAQPADPAAEMMPWVRKHFRLGQGWPGKTPREQRQAEARCLGFLRELIAKGRTPEDVANALRGAALLRDRGDLQRRHWVRIGEPMFTRILNKTQEAGPSFWQEALDAWSKHLESLAEAANPPGPGGGGLQRVVIDIRGAA
jgi:hypothetical protein